MKELIILSGLGLFALASEVFNFKKILFQILSTTKGWMMFL